MIRVQSTFLQPRKYDCLLLTGWENGTTEGRIAQVADDRNQNVLYLLDHLCRHRIKGTGFRWHTGSRKKFGDFRTANWRAVTEAVSGSKNIRRCSSRRSGPDVLDFTLENVRKSCTVRVKADVVGFAGGDSSLLTLDHSARVSCLDSEITHLQSSAYIVFGLEQ